jgi:uncharacterized DUF497 family protein
VDDFEIRYDPRKAEENLRKHGISSEEAAETMRDLFAAVCRDRNRTPRIATSSSANRLLATRFSFATRSKTISRG